MNPAPQPPNESARLAALREFQILDTPKEEDFDRITRLAAQLCGTSMALVTLVDENRQWFKSRVGILRTETPRDWSFCAHAIAGREIFEVPDARKDPRFADNPLVEAREVLFYAGAPLVTAAGHALGTVSVLDSEPRKLSAEQREALSALAALALRQIETRRAGRTLAREVRDRDFALQFCLTLAAAEGVDPMLDLAAKHLAEHFEATAAIWLVEANTGQLELRSSARSAAASSAAELDARNAAIGAMVERIGRTREGWSTESLPPASAATEAAQLESAGVGAFMGIPLLKQREVLGVVAVFRANPIGCEPTGSCAMLATMLGLAIAARIDEERLRRANTELERLAKERSGALAETERRHQMLLANLPGMAYRCRNTREWKTDFVSEGSRGLIGFAPEALTSGAVKYGDLVHPDDGERVWKEVQAALNQRKAFALEYRVKHADGDWRWVWEHGRGIDENGGEIEYIEGFVTDISGRKQGESQALRAQRLESLGTLAGGVAHDLNNALAPILMGLELIRAQTTGVSDQLINTMMASARRGADMVRQLLMFARGAEGTRRMIPPKHVLQEMEQIVRGSFPKNIEVEVDYPRHVPAVFADPTQLHQVLLNLCVNARDAMPDGGKLRLAIELAHIDPSFASSVPDAQPGNYVVLRVTDTGSGIAPEIIDRIFEPFFSTKGLEKGTGLGLSTALGIVRSHGGFLRVESTPGQGSTFSVYVRAADGAECDVGLAAEPPLRGNGEHILVVDDEPAVRHVSQSVLTALNFRVVLARDGTEALLKAAAHQDDLRVVITDLQMPHMDGLTFVRVIRRLLPNAGIIVASGRLDDRTEKEFAALGVKAVLHKPFTQDRLTSALRTVLAERQ